MASAFILAIDQGTTSTRAVVYGPDGRALGSAIRELRAILSQPRLGGARPGRNLAGDGRRGPAGAGPEPASPHATWPALA